MAMVVSIVNVTDAPESKKTPTRLAIYTALLDPGEELKLPAAMVDARLRKLETDGFIVIGQLPSWYQASKARKLGRQELTQAELEKRHTTKPKVEAPATLPPVEEAPPEPPKTKRVKLEDLADSKDKTDKK